MTLRAGALTGLMNQPSAQVIDGSLKFDNDKSQYLTRTPGSAGNRRTWTWSGWLKIDGDFANRNLNYGGNIFFGTHDGQPTWISFNVTTPYLQFSYHDGSSYRAQQIRGCI